MNPQDIELTLEQKKRLAALAAQKGATWQQVLDEALNVPFNGDAAVGADGITGLFADEPELADAIADDAMATRESDPLRR